MNLVLLGLDSRLLLFIELFETSFLGFSRFFLDGLDALSLLSVVRVLEDFVDLLLLLGLVLNDEVGCELVVLSSNFLLGVDSFRLDLLGVLLLLKLSATLETFLQDSVKFLLLALLVHIHDAIQLVKTLIVVLKKSFFLFVIQIGVILDLGYKLVVAGI